MPYSKCSKCKQTRLDVPSQGHWKYCKACLIERKTNKVIKQITQYTDFIKDTLTKDKERKINAQSKLGKCICPIPAIIDKVVWCARCGKVY